MARQGPGWVNVLDKTARNGWVIKARGQSEKGWTGFSGIGQIGPDHGAAQINQANGRPSKDRLG